MKRHFLMTTVVAIALALFCFTARAGKPDKPGGGGGGGNPGNAMVIVQLQTGDGVGTHDEAYDVNDLREVVGRVSLTSGELSAACWTVVETDGVVQSTLGLLDGGHSATGINNLGEIVGQTDDALGNPSGVYWASSSSSPIVLPLLPGFNVSLPKEINEGGLICGTVAVNGDLQSGQSVLWQVTSGANGPVVSQPMILPAGSSAQDISSPDGSGIAVVVGMHRPTWTPLRWVVQTLPDGTISIPAVPEVLDDLGVGAFATGVNNNGVVCGRTEFDAVVWSGASASILNRPGKGKNQVPRAWAWGIGDSGIVVGQAGSLIDSRACVWDGISGSLTYLDDYLDPDSPLLGLGSAEAVNAFGDIVGRGWDGAFIAIPVSP